jgi:XTP/dITP diphosphohydrolase
MLVTLASANGDKVRELAALLATRLRLVAAPEGYVEPEENGCSYLENARIKARALFARTRRAVLADDSGLEVDALGGRPGIHSARYGTTAEDRCRRLLGELTGRSGEERRARFRTAIVLLLDDGSEISAEGSCEGEIADRPRGAGGFGYDPLFLVPHLGRTFGELPSEEKDRLSARAAAARALVGTLDRLGQEG